jgi:hypothetical protein
MQMKPPRWVATVKGNAQIVLRALWFFANGDGSVPASLYALVQYTGLSVDAIIKALWKLQELNLIFNRDPSKSDISDLAALVHFQLRLDMPPAMIREVPICPE